MARLLNPFLEDDPLYNDVHGAAGLGFFLSIDRYFAQHLMSLTIHYPVGASVE